MEPENTKGRSTITLSCSPEDKKLLKMAAVERGTTVSAMLHEWVERELKPGKEGK